MIVAEANDKCHLGDLSVKSSSTAQGDNSVSNYVQGGVSTNVTFAHPGVNSPRLDSRIYFNQAKCTMPIELSTQRFDKNMNYF